MNMKKILKVQGSRLTSQFSALTIASVLALTTVTMSSCEDMLTVDTGDKTYVNANDTLYSYLGIMKCVQAVAERQVILGELRGDLVATTEYVTDTLHAIANFDNPQDGSCSMLEITDYYNIINNCNLYIHNADTSAVKSNVKYMVPEYAQVQAIRAWTYLQLVRNYGEVPFITDPISSLDVVKNFNYQANLVNKDNLPERIVATGILDLINEEYPQYGTFDNGATSIASRKMMFPIQLILGDIYLLRGGSKADYEQAATYYYQWLSKNAPNVTTQYCSATKQRTMSASGSDYGYSASGTGETWGQWAGKYSYSTTDDVITLIPSSANKQFGTMLTRVADIYGYTPTSSQSSSTSENDDGEEETSTSGSISVSRNYKSQTTPSGAFYTLNFDQSYIYYDNSTTVPTRIAYESGDARYGVSIENFTYDSESYQLCAKASKGATFYYSVPVYRKTLIWLRLAEALNRAGLPQIAFAVLKDGLSPDNLPTHALRYDTHPQLTEAGDTIFDENGEIIYQTDTIPYLRLNSVGAMYYVDSDQLDQFNTLLNFNDDAWKGNYGIHARGCGYGNWTQSSEIAVRTNIMGYNDTISYDYRTLIIGQGYDPDDNDQAIEAVENLIVDELALETAFEGNRFTDLVRIATHRTDGAQWLAAKIADRNVKKGTYSKAEPSGTRDQELYTKLLNKSNWYFEKPQWSY